MGLEPTYSTWEKVVLQYNAFKYMQLVALAILCFPICYNGFQGDRYSATLTGFMAFLVLLDCKHIFDVIFHAKRPTMCRYMEQAIYSFLSVSGVALSILYVVSYTDTPLRYQTWGPKILDRLPHISFFSCCIHTMVGFEYEYRRKLLFQFRKKLQQEDVGPVPEAI